jgi:membrane protease YdiL (CAAX protease family)
VAVYLLFHWTATALGSDRGQAGLVVGALVVGATLAVERVLFGQPTGSAARALGLGRPAAHGVIVATCVGLALALVIPAFARLTGASISGYPGWTALLPGLFAQAGVAEEVLFRGYLFGHVRRGREFRRAAALATLPFVAVHLVMFGTMPWPVALAAVALSAIMAFPLAYLFELGGSTIWAPAIVHCVAQGAIKVVEVGGASPTLLPVVWMAACAAIPFLVFLVPRPLPAGGTALHLSASG